jgi:hypothetical protein
MSLDLTSYAILGLANFLESSGGKAMTKLLENARGGGENFALRHGLISSTLTLDLTTCSVP